MFIFSPLPLIYVKKSIYDKDDGQEKKNSCMQLEICMYL